MSQAKVHGKLTYELSTQLRTLFDGGSIDKNRYGLYIDPHRGNPHLPAPAHNVHVLPHLGEAGTHETGLSQCDIMISSNSKNARRAMLLIEVEEGLDGTAPKAILGDVFNVWMGNAIRCERTAFELRETKLWVVVFEPAKGGKAKQYTGLQSCLDKLRDPVQNVLHSTVRVTATEIVRVKVGSDSLITTVMDKIRSELPCLFTRR